MLSNSPQTALIVIAYGFSIHPRRLSLTTLRLFPPRSQIKYPIPVSARIIGVLNSRSSRSRLGGTKLLYAWNMLLLDIPPAQRESAEAGNWNPVVRCQNPKSGRMNPSQSGG